ncbi:MAG: ABC transporter permease [Gaiellaceae bacterium]
MIRIRLWAERGRALIRSRAVRAAMVVLATLVVYCLAWPAMSPDGPDGVDLSRSRQGPSLDHPLGTDQLGRDLLTRLAEGGQTTFLIAGGALAVILTIGTLYGTIAGLAGGKVDDTLMRIVDGLLAIPRYPIAIVILVVLSTHAQTIAAMAFALSITGWMLTARLVRGEVRRLKQRPFITAARAGGASWARIARRHILPNTVGTILIAVFLELPAVILGEAFLSVLGLGPNPPTATWGNIAQSGLHFFRLWEMFLATAAITIFVLSANIIADGLHDVLDPRRASQSR